MRKRPVLWHDPTLRLPSYMAPCPLSWAVHTIDLPRAWQARDSCQVGRFVWRWLGPYHTGWLLQTTPSFGHLSGQLLVPQLYWGIFRLQYCCLSPTSWLAPQLQHLKPKCHMYDVLSFLDHLQSTGHFLSQRSPGKFDIYLTAACSPWIA